jgi:hypothetical protein
LALVASAVRTFAVAIDHAGELVASWWAERHPARYRCPFCGEVVWRTSPEPYVESFCPCVGAMVRVRREGRGEPDTAPGAFARYFASLIERRRG